MRVSPKAARRAGSCPAPCLQARHHRPPQPQIPCPVSTPREACAVPRPATHVCPLNRALLRAHRAVAGSGISKPFPGPSDFRGGPSERGFAGWPLLQEGSWHGGLLSPGFAASEAPPAACRGLFFICLPRPLPGREQDNGDTWAPRGVRARHAFSQWASVPFRRSRSVP